MSTTVPMFSVCICSCGRPTLVDTITSVLQQDLSPGCRVEIVVVDNSEEAKCLEDVKKLQATSPSNMEIKYIHDASNNLSAIRNTSVSACCGAFVAFIDDDEVAAPEWLMELRAPIEAGSADVTVGEVLSVYSDSCPDWVSSGKLLDKFKFKDGTRLSKGHTASAMMRRQLAERYEFNLKFGQSGDEDTDLFFRMSLDGFRIRYCKKALVTEYNSPDRENWEYLRKRNVTTGQCYARIIFPRLSPSQKVLATISVVAKSFGFLGLAIFSFLSRKNSSFFKLRAIRNFTKLRWILRSNEGFVRLYCTNET